MTRLRLALIVLCAFAISAHGKGARANEILGGISVTASVHGSCIVQSAASATESITVNCVKGLLPHVTTSSATLQTVRALIASSGTNDIGLTGLPSAWTLVSVDL